MPQETHLFQFFRANHLNFGAYEWLRSKIVVVPTSRVGLQKQCLLSFSLLQRVKLVFVSFAFSSQFFGYRLALIVNNIVNINAKFGADFYRVIILVCRRIILFVGYLQIAVVHPTNSNIIEGHPSLVLAQKTITLIQLFFYST